MGSKYPIKALKDVGVRLYDCVHATPKAAKKGYPYIAIPNIQEGRLNLNEVRLISKKDFEKWTEKLKPQEGDIIVTRRGRVGDIAPIPKDLECAIGQNLIILRSEGNQVYQKYLRWVLTGLQYKREVEKFLNVGAIFNSLNCRDIPKFELPFPDVEKQKTIAKFFDAIEDKITLNKRINQTLEQISQTTFKSWFIDFEPVKAKEHIKNLGGDAAQIERASQTIISGAINLEDIIAEASLTDLNNEIQRRLETKLGCQTKEQQCKLVETAKLFPDKLVESELGMIPEGWKISTIGEEVDVVGGGTPSTKNKDFWKNGKINWTTPRDLSKLSDKVLLNTDRKITKQGLTKISSGLLPVNTVLLSSRAPVGYLSLTKIPVAINQGYIAMKCEKILSPEFVLQWANSIMSEIKQRASGTTFAEISKKNFRLIPVLVPAPKIVDSFTLFNSDLYNRISKNVSESDILTNLRDSLLPKLLSGEISV